MNFSKDNKRLKVGISQGDINGISYEVIIKSLMDNRIFEIFTPILYGSSKIVAYHRKALNITNFSMNNIKSPTDANTKRSNIINCLDDNIRVELGKSTQMAGEASLMSLERVIEDIKTGEIGKEYGLVKAQAEKMVDQIAVFIAPKIIGSGISAIGDLETKFIENSIELKNMNTKTTGPDILITASVNYTGATI